MAELLACPFCRELFTEEDELEVCPTCGVEIRPLRELPPSAELILEREAEIEQTPVELRQRSFWDVGRGRGLLVLCSVLGLLSFFLPWFSMTQPETATLAGYHLARYYAGWLWGGAVGWFVLVPLVLTRRSIMAMRGVRIVCTLFASVTLGEILVLLSLSPASQTVFHVEYRWEWGLWTSAVVSVLGTVVASRFGGSLPEPSRPTQPPASGPRSPPGATLH